MFDLKMLIGLEVSDAKNFISNYGEYKVNIIINSKPNEKTDTMIVCNAKKQDDVINLYCGEFYLNMKV